MTLKIPSHIHVEYKLVSSLGLLGALFSSAGDFLAAVFLPASITCMYIAGNRRDQCGKSSYRCIHSVRFGKGGGGGGWWGH